MENFDKRVSDFIHEHHVLTLATSREGVPYCANCFYAYLPEEQLLVFTSDYETNHIQDVQQQDKVAGSIVLETSTIGKIQGIQFVGKISEPQGDLKKKINRAYLKRFPYAILKKTTLWAVELQFVKMTDNRLGFGKKLIYGSL